MDQKNLSFAALTIVTVTMLASSATSAQTIEEATSRVEFSGAGFYEWETRNATFEVFDFWPSSEPHVRTILLRQVESEKRASGMEGSQDPHIRVDAFYLGKDGLSPPIWALDVMANDGGPRYLGDFGHAYVATVWACCGTVTSELYFSLVNGTHLLTTNGQIATLSVPNSGGVVRLAGVETQWSISPVYNPDLAPEFVDRSDIFGIVAYASPIARIERVAIVVQGVDSAGMARMFALPELTWVPGDGSESARNLNLWSLDGERDSANLTGVSLRVAFKPEVWVEIPISGDRLDIDNASMAESLTLELLQS